MSAPAAPRPDEAVAGPGSAADAPAPTTTRARLAPRRPATRRAT